MDKAYLNTLLIFAVKHLSQDQLDNLAAHCIPLFGPNGLRRYLAERDIEAFVKLYFPDEFYLDFPPIHKRMLADIQEVRDRCVAGRPGVKLARAIPRNHAKSTYYSRVLPLHGFLFGWSPLTVILGNNDDAAKRFVANVKNVVEFNPALLEDFPGIKGQYWGNEKLEASNGVVITSFGVGSGSIRGVSTGQHRPSLVILDDIDDDRSVRSAVELANNKDWLDKTVMALGDNVSYTTSFVAVGTIIRKTSLMKYILDSADFDSLIEQRIKRWSTNPALWQQWEAQYLDCAREGIQPKDASEDAFYQEHKDALLADTEVLWDKRDEYYYAMVYRLARGMAAFNSEMQNAPQDTAGAFGNLTFVSLPTDEREYDLLAALDPTEKGGKSNDLAAYVEVLFHRKRKQVIVSYVDAKQRSYSDTIDAVVKRVRFRGKRYSGFWVETNAAGGIIRDLLSERFHQEAIPFNVSGVHNTLKKEERIDALSEFIQRGQLLFADNLAPELHAELDSWPLSQTDDCLDAIATIVLYLKNQGLMDLLFVE